MKGNIIYFSVASPFLCCCSGGNCIYFPKTLGMFLPPSVIIYQQLFSFLPCLQKLPEKSE